MSMSYSITAFQKREAFEFHACARWRKRGEKKRVGTEKENQKMTVPTDNKAATRLQKCTSVDVVPAAFAKVAV